MTLGEITLSGGESSSLDKWAIVQASRRGRAEQLERQQLVTARLSELLFGLELNLEEMAQYRGRLVEALGQIDRLENEPSLPALNPPARIPRDEMLLRLGGMTWRPFEVSQKTIEIPPAQKIFRTTLAKAVKEHIALNPKSEPRSFHEVGIVVAQGAEGTRYGSDRVELSSWGLSVVSSQDYPQVAQLRLPPRFPSQAEIVQFRAS